MFIGTPCRTSCTEYMQIGTVHQLNDSSGVYVPWEFMYHGSLCTMGVYVPWEYMYNGSLCTMGVYVPWECAYFAGELKYKVPEVSC